jgi:mRNA deadenylase 3'-5' endonuclease subunit Ccr4
MTAVQTLGSFPDSLPPCSGQQIRILTYNILADQYTSQEFAQKVIFSHVAPEVLDFNYRKQLIFKQLHRSGADVICLQEVDAKVFERYLYPMMEGIGFEGVYANKAGQVYEGSALFYRKELFSLTAWCALLSYGFLSLCLCVIMRKVDTFSTRCVYQRDLVPTHRACPFHWMQL